MPLQGNNAGLPLQGNKGMTSTRLQGQMLLLTCSGAQWWEPMLVSTCSVHAKHKEGLAPGPCMPPHAGEGSGDLT